MEQKVMWDYYQGEGEDSFSGVAKRLSFLVNAALKVPTMGKDQRVLNIGVGNGYLERYAAKKGFTSSSLDPSEVAIEKLRRAGFDGKVGYMESIPYEDGTFAFVFCSEVIEHLPNQSLKASIAEIKRVLSKDGYLLGTVPYDELLLANHVICPACATSFHRWGHEQSFNKSVMKTLLEDSGFEVIRLEPYSFLSLAGKDLRGKIKALGSWVLGRLGVTIANPCLLFIARKL